MNIKGITRENVLSLVFLFIPHGTALSVCKRARVYVLLEYLMEIVRIREAERVGYIVDRRVSIRKKCESAVNADTVDIIYRSLSDALLKHLCKVIG